MYKKVHKIKHFNIFLLTIVLCFYFTDTISTTKDTARVVQLNPGETYVITPSIILCVISKVDYDKIVLKKENKGIWYFKYIAVNKDLQLANTVGIKLINIIALKNIKIEMLKERLKKELLYRKAESL